MASVVKLEKGSRKNRVLCVGLLCLDNIYVLPDFPEEDSDVRATSQARSRGGNASTNTVLLAQLGWEHVEFMGSIGDTYDTDFCLDELRKYGVIVENCVKRKGLDQPNTCAVINKSNGSRTLIHYHAGFPEISYDEFSGMDLNLYKLIHLEGRRNIDTLVKILQRISDWNEESTHHRIKTSFELEKPKDYRSILPLPDVLFVSSEYAESQGYKDMQTAVVELSEYTKEGSIIICAWGSKGACGGVKNSSPISPDDLSMVPSYPPAGGVIDTLGAGDCFIAACLYSLLNLDFNGLSKELLPRVLNFGCKVAGYKCGVYGFELSSDMIIQFKQEL